MKTPINVMKKNPRKTPPMINDRRLASAVDAESADAAAADLASAF